VWSASGDLFGGSASGWHVIDHGAQFNANADRVWGVQAEEFELLQDGTSRAKIYHRGNLRESGFPDTGETNELGAGRAMAFANGRIWLATDDGRSFMAGDITRGPSGSPTYDFRDAVLKKTENEFLAQGGRFAVPFSAGVINAFAQPAQADTPGNTGPLVALTQEGAYGINLPIERDQWAALRSPPVTVLANGEGCVGPMAFCMMNGDVLFRAPSGIRSLRRGYRDLATGWTNRLVSWELSRVQAQTQIEALRLSSAAYFDYRAFFTDRPENAVQWVPAVVEPPTPAQPGINRGIVFRWVTPMLTAGIASITQEKTPVWEGPWTGLRLFQLLPVTVTRKPRLFGVALTEENTIALYEMDGSRRRDLGSDFVLEPPTPEGGEPPENQQEVHIEHDIPWGFESRAFFTKERLQRKRLKDLELALTGILGDVTVRVLYRQIGAANWQLWGEKTVTLTPCLSTVCPQATNADGSPIAGKTGLALPSGNVSPGVLYPVRFGDPDDSTCLTTVGRYPPEGYAFQLRLEFSAACTLSYLLVRAVLLPRIEAVECETTIPLTPEGVCQSNQVEHTHLIP
jgi:hypothetical protein